MATLSWKDNRLPADDVAPFDSTVMLVGPKVRVADMVTDSVAWCKENEGVSLSLMIYCHGDSGFLQICKENLFVHNLKLLAPLKPYFDVVSIHACLIAKGSVGRAFCIKLAQVLNAPVDGAVELQGNTGPNTPYGQLDDSKYDGNYFRHLPSGERKGPLRSDMPRIVHPGMY